MDSDIKNALIITAVIIPAVSFILLKIYKRRMKADERRDLDSFMRFLRLQIPNMLQVITFVAFISFLLKKDGTFLLVLIPTLSLIMLYLFEALNEYVKTYKSEKLNNNRMGRFLVLFCVCFISPLIVLFTIAHYAA